MRREILTAAALFVVALLAHALVALSMLPPWRFLKYTLAAEQLRSGELAAERLVDFSPLYLQIHLLAERLPDPVSAVRLVQVLVVALAVVLFYGVMRRRFPWLLSVVAALLLLLDRTLLVYTHVLEPEVWLLFFLVALLFAVDGRWRGAPLVAGVCGGLGLLTRPTLLPLLLVVPLYLWLRRSAQREAWRPIVWFLLPVVMALALLAVRGAWATGDPLVPTMNPGTVFFEGNNPLSRGTSAVYPPVVTELTQLPDARPDSAHDNYRRVARQAEGGSLGVAEVNAYWSSRARRFVVDRPLHWLAVVTQKLSLALHDARLHDVPAAWLFDRRIWLPGLSMALLSSLALPGMLFAAREWRVHLLAYVVVAGQLAVMLLFYVSARQRLVLVPVLLIFAAATAERLRRAPRAAWLALAGGCWLVLSLPSDLLREQEHRFARGAELTIARQRVMERFTSEPRAWLTDEAASVLALVPEAIDQMRPAFLSQEEMDLDERILRAALARALGGRGSRSEQFDLGLLALRASRLDEAEAIFTELDELGFRAYRGSFTAPLPRFYRGRIARLRGDVERAVGLLEGALVLAPGDPFVLAELLALTEERRYQELLHRYFSPLDAQFLLGRALLAHGEHQKAASCFFYVVPRLPELRSARVHLAAALAGTGRIESAAATYLEAMAMAPEPLLLDPDIPELMRRWASSPSASPLDRFHAAQVLHRYGYLSEGLQILAGLAVAGHAGEETRPSAIEVRAEEERIRRALSPPETAATAGALAQSSQ